MKRHSGLAVSLKFIFVSTFAISFASFPSARFSEARAQQQQIVWSDQEKPILEQIRTLRRLNTGERTRKTKELALQIRQLPPGANKVRLAYGLAGLSTEGDFGHDTLQEVATTLSGALREHPLPATPKGPPAPYVELAQLVRYEHVNGALDDPQYASAVAQLDADDTKHKQADFSLTDLQGRTWNLKELRGKVVLVNFWATWCPPCRSEMPDLDALYNQFKDQGFVVLGISDEDLGKVKPYIDQNHYNYPILLDPEARVHKAYNIEGIPRSFLYDREGNLVAQAIDMRTHEQFMEMLGLAGLK